MYMVFLNDLLYLLIILRHSKRGNLKVTGTDMKGWIQKKARHPEAMIFKCCWIPQVSIVLDC